MTGRREARQWAMQILFELDVNPQDCEAILCRFSAERGADSASAEFAKELVRGTREHLESIDGLIQEYAENWDISRIGRIDKNVMRIALYEMLYRKDIPPVVSINEAVDIAKEFGSDNSGKFVNGILDRARKQMDRPAREPIEESEGEKESAR